MACDVSPVAMFLYWAGLVPYLELFWAGPVKKITLYYISFDNEDEDQDDEDHLFHGLVMITGLGTPSSGLVSIITFNSFTTSSSVHPFMENTNFSRCANRKTICDLPYSEGYV